MSEPNDSPPKVNWNELEARPAFRSLLAAKGRFLIASFFFFVIYYFALLVLVGWFPDLMKKEVFGRINLAYLFALSQFFMAWILALVYMRKAAQWDKAAAEIIKGH